VCRVNCAQLAHVAVDVDAAVGPLDIAMNIGEAQTSRSIRNDYCFRATFGVCFTHEEHPVRRHYQAYLQVWSGAITDCGALECKNIIVTNKNIRAIYTARVGEVIHAIEILGADLVAVSQYLNAGRTMVELWIAENPPARNAMEGARAVMIDLAERNLTRGLIRGERWATELALLKTAEGQRRGYGDRVTVDIERESAVLGIDVGRVIDQVAIQLAAAALGSGVTELDSEVVAPSQIQLGSDDI
jgi:hypothetical protein